MGSEGEAGAGGRAIAATTERPCADEEPLLASPTLQAGEANTLCAPLTDNNETQPTDPTADDVHEFPLRAVLALCSVAFFVNLQPSEAFLTNYLKENKGLDNHDLDTIVWPTNLYASFALLLPAGLLAESVGYRATILGGLLAREVTRAVLLFGRGLGLMALTQLTYAAGTSVNIIFYSYVYLAVPAAHYQRATAMVHAAYHLGNVLGSALGQLLVSYAHTPLQSLFYISWAMTTAGVVCFALLLPPMRKDHTQPPSLARLLLERGWRPALADLRQLYTPLPVQLWSVWWLLAFGTNNIIGNYYQNQIYNLDKDSPLGWVEVCMETASTLGALLPALILASLLPRSLALAMGAAAACGSLYLAIVLAPHSLWCSYVCNVAAVAVYSFAYATASAACASSLGSGRYALLFATNSFVSLGIATAAQAAGAANGLSTDAYYRLAAGSEYLLLLALAAWAWVTRRRHLHAAAALSWSSSPTAASQRQPLLGPDVPMLTPT